jgi:hypothetical protein
VQPLPGIAVSAFVEFGKIVVKIGPLMGPARNPLDMVGHCDMAQPQLERLRVHSSAIVWFPSRLCVECMCKSLAIIVF